MRVSYNKLWKLLIDKNMKKSQLREAVGASKSTFAKLGKNENVTLPVLLSICSYLHCDFGDIMEAVQEDKENKTI
ncbi:MAG TPA: helix-turn-helix transcriptional regulator [Clostridiales bacterium]|nr:helix-turn-helix transcriptional regulator [Clostridiales bacterium]